ncbi:hypothetical protein LINPERPRIM_LOCUS3293 [Linum perenne]
MEKQLRTFGTRGPSSIEELRHRSWETSISHIFREGNVVADLLAHHGHSLNFGIHTDCIYPPEVRSAI